MTGLVFLAIGLAYWTAAAFLCNWYYGRIYGRRLRLGRVWAAHSALLWGRRCPGWEQRPSQTPPKCVAPGSARALRGDYLASPVVGGQARTKPTTK